MLHAGTLLEIGDRELDGGVVAVELVGLDGGKVDVRDERGVPPPVT